MPSGAYPGYWQKSGISQIDIKAVQRKERQKMSDNSTTVTKQETLAALRNSGRTLCCYVGSDKAPLCEM